MKLKKAVVEHKIYQLKDGGYKVYGKIINAEDNQLMESFEKEYHFNKREYVAVTSLKEIYNLCSKFNFDYVEKLYSTDQALLNSKI